MIVSKEAWRKQVITQRSDLVYTSESTERLAGYPGEAGGNIYCIRSVAAYERAIKTKAKGVKNARGEDMILTDRHVLVTTTGNFVLNKLRRLVHVRIIKRVTCEDGIVRGELVIHPHCKEVVCGVISRVPNIESGSATKIWTIG